MKNKRSLKLISAETILTVLIIAGVLGGPLQAGQDTFSVNFYAWGQGGANFWDQADWRATLTLEAEQSAGFDDWNTTGWVNYAVPWDPATPQNPITITSNQGSAATFTLITVRNGGPLYWSAKRSTLLDDGNGDLMDGHANGTEDAGERFEMEVSDVPFGHYDVIIYMGANDAQFGDGTGKIVFNGGPEQSFTLKRPPFDGTFIEMVDDVTPGNYIVYKRVTGSSFKVQVQGNGFNHISPCGFQFRNVGPSNPVPPDGSQAYIGDVDLSWTNMDPNAPGGPMFVDVWFGTDPNELSGNMTLIVDATTPEGRDATGVTVPGLDIGTYYWRVDSYAYGDPTVVTYGDASDPNFAPIIPGKMWTFEIPSTPILEEEPLDANVYPGETVVLTVVAKNPYTRDDTGLNYQWYKDGVAVPDATESVLTIADMQPENDGLYKCIVGFTDPDKKGTSETREAEVKAKRMVGHWPFDGNLNNMIGSNHGTPVGSPDLTAAGKVGSNSVKTSVGNYLYVPWTPTRSFSLSFFVLPEINNGNDYIIGCGNPVGAENFFARMNNLTTGYDVAFNFGGVRFAYLTYPVAWNHEVFTYDHPTGTAKWYINGVLVGTISSLILNQPIDTQIYVGNRKDGLRRFTGNIDDLRLYNYAIDEFEAARLYVDANPGTVICVSPVAMDLNNDCRNNLEDFALFAEQWMVCNRNPMASCP